MSNIRENNMQSYVDLTNFVKIVQFHPKHAHLVRGRAERQTMTVHWHSAVPDS